MRDIETRGAEGISDAKDYFDVFERNFKQTLTEIEEESTKRSMIKEMVNGSFAKLDKLLDKYEDFYNNLSYDTSLSVLKNTTRKYIKDAKKILVARPIGSVRISDAVEEIQQPRNLFDILNKPKERNPLNDTVDKMFSEKKGEISKNIRSYRESKDIISYVEDGIEYFFKVDPIIKDAYNLSNGTVSLIGELLKKSKDLVQSTITGVLNPAFAIPSALMSTTEALTVLPKIISKLENVDGFSRLDYMKQIGKSFVKLYVDDVKNLIINLYERELVKTFGNLDTPMGKILSNFNIEKFKADITKSLLTKIKETGGASVRPLTSSRSNFYTLTKDSIISPAIERKLTNLYGVDGAYQVIKMFNFLQRAIREAPTLALTEYVGKLNKAIDINGEVDPKKLIQVVDVINNYTANVGKMGSGSGLLGAISKAISDYGLYGNVMIKSIAPKVRASGIDKGISNIYKLTKDLYDPNVRYYDILMNMQNNAKDLANNKFIQGLIFTSFIPTILAYLWNYGSKDNMETYHSLTDYDKASKLIFTNILGKNNHIILPIDQEVALSNTLFSTILDNILGMSAYNETDPAFDNSKLIMQALSRSFGLDSIPALDILANISGYDINLNMLDDKSFITPLKRNVINQDLSETAYQNGLVNQQTTQLINSIFGIAGSALLGSFEEANVGSNNETGFEDFNSSIVDRFTKSARLITGNKTISTYNETSKYVYNKRNLFNKIASIQNKNVKQQQIYEFIKLYKRNRIDPIHNTITSIRKELNNIRSLGIMNGQVLKYQERKDAANELNTKMQQYFAREYHEFQNLNDLLEQQFGNGITLDNFMEKLYE